MGVNDNIFDDIVRSRLGLIRFEHRTGRRIRSIFRSVERENLAYLLSLDEYQLPKYGAQHKLAILRELSSRYRFGSDDAIREISEAMQEAARKEGRDMYFSMQKNIPSELGEYGISLTQVPEQALIEILDSPVLGDFTQSVREYSGKFNMDTSAALDRALGASLVHGEGVAEISRRLAEITGRRAKDMETFSRTAIQTAGYRAQKSFYEQNKDVISKVVYMATFDLRTCPICAGYHGKEYDIGKEPPVPIHANCRCTFTPKTKSWEELGARVKMAPLAPATIASMDGGVPDTMSLEAWIKKQAKTEDGMKVLARNWGRGRAEHFKKGKVGLSDLAVRRNGYNRVKALREL